MGMATAERDMVVLLEVLAAVRYKYDYWLPS